MLDTIVIDARLREMREQPDPALKWDESCRGSARALALFVGPSPGGAKVTERRPRIPDCRPALWNESYDKPLTFSAGFRASWKLLVEAVFSVPYATAGKLLALGNLDWLGNPAAADVKEEFMLEGAPSVLKMLDACLPELVLPMDMKTFRVVRVAMEADGFAVAECPVNKFYVRLNAVAAARKIRCFRATSPKGHSLVVIKLPQHPARMFQAELGARCGRAVRLAAQQIATGELVDVTEP